MMNGFNYPTTEVNKGFGARYFTAIRLCCGIGHYFKHLNEVKLILLSRYSLKTFLNQKPHNVINHLELIMLNAH